jgi:hypothetical protein
MKNKIIQILFLLIVSSVISHGQPLENKNYDTKIKTIQCHKEGWPLSYPIISLRSEEIIHLSFDDLSGDIRNFNYSIIHCNENWEPSHILESEYVSGINQVSILNYQYSFNTSIDYVHYNVSIPNEDIQLNYSGNYIIKVYEDFNVDNPVLMQRFMVVNPLVNIFPQVKYTMNSSLREAKQEINFTIKHPNLTILNPLDEVKVNIYQNQRSDNAITQIKPQYLKAGELVYNYNRKTLFDGGNEFRWLDVRSIRFHSDKIKQISFHDPYYHVELYPDRPVQSSNYYFKNDFNGKYVIDIQEQRDPEIEADYVIVHFSFPREDPFIGGEVHLLGGLTNWDLSEKSRMHYNVNFKQYEIALLLKQGFYNYQLAYKPGGSKKANTQLFEGSYGQTENDYLILVYYRGISDQYDQLIGATVVNSLNP